MDDPFKESTVAKWLGITESEYQSLYSISKRTHKCLKIDCTIISGNYEDLLCPAHRREYNKWTEQFFPLIYKVEEKK